MGYIVLAYRGFTGLLRGIHPLVHAARSPAIHAHRAPEQREMRMKRPGWYQMRVTIFARDNYLCQLCGCICIEGHPLKKPVCDHIVPHRGDVELYYDMDNLQTLCASCHSRDKQREEAADLHKKPKFDKSGWPI